MKAYFVFMNEARWQMDQARKPNPRNPKDVIHPALARSKRRNRFLLAQALLRTLIFLLRPATPNRYLVRRKPVKSTGSLLNSTKTPWSSVTAAFGKTVISCQMPCMKAWKKQQVYQLSHPHRLALKCLVFSSRQSSLNNFEF